MEHRIQDGEIKLDFSGKTLYNTCINWEKGKKMTKEDLYEMICETEMNLDAYYISGSDYDIESTERQYSYLIRQLASIGE